MSKWEIWNDPLDDNNGPIGIMCDGEPAFMALGDDKEGPGQPTATKRINTIVTACSHFEEMRHALEMVVRDLDNRQLQSGTICVREIARDVLARIEGGE